MNLPTVRRLLAAALVLCTATLHGPAPAGADVVTYPGCTIAALHKYRFVGEGVRCIQTALATQGFPVQKIDGKFGLRTHLTVWEFQKVNGLPVDGIVGEQTARALGIWDGAVPVPNPILETRVVGYSVRGRTIRAYRLGTPGGKVVLAVGNTHGDEPAGLAITFFLRHGAVIPPGIDLWVVDTINPDGLVAKTRGNAHGVDLNRNFRTADWRRTGRGTRNYSGRAAGSEPETYVISNFVKAIQPKVAVWWHQSWNFTDAQTTVSNPALVSEFAERSGLALRTVPCGKGPCHGNASVYVNTTVPGATSFIVELPSRLSLSDAARNANALLAIGLAA